MNQQTPVEFSARTRRENIERMAREKFDVAVIGGGIVGAGVALDAAARGLTVALIEKNDFASGTSSRSSKLIHGGLRYLQHGEFGLVREALREREALLKIAPHLCRPIPFVLPIYSGGKPSPLGGSRLKLGVGLWLYDAMAQSEDGWRHRWISSKEALRLVPTLDADQLRGAYVYNDCVTDDARLVIEVVKAAAACGAVAVNYCNANGFIKDGGKSVGVSVEDSIGNAQFELRASAVVNATGVWVDELGRRADKNQTMRMQVSKGIHIVLPIEKLRMKSAALIPSADGRRFHFVIPWSGRILVGTTDTPYDGDLSEPRATESEVSELVGAVARSFPSARVSESDVISSFAGLRPLVARDGKPTTDLSRREEIVEGESGLISVFGGKLTTYRAIAERVVRCVTEKLGRSPVRRGEAIVLAGGKLRRETSENATPHLRPEVGEHLAATYAGNCLAVSVIAGESEDLRQQLVEGLPCIGAEVIYAARHEMAMTVEDVLERRTRLALLARDGGQECREVIKKLLEKESAR